MIAIIDYGMGNLKSIAKIVEYLGQAVTVTNAADQIKSAHKIILPGVGSFYKAMTNLEKMGIIDLILSQVACGKPFLGICLGMQLLAKLGHEGGKKRGLGIVDAEVDLFNKELETETMNIPHIGFNEIQIQKESALFKGLNSKTDFYFNHSYRVVCRDTHVVTSCADNCETFVSSLEIDNVFGVQFHPELSQNNGLALIKNFISL